MTKRRRAEHINTAIGHLSDVAVGACAAFIHLIWLLGVKFGLSARTCPFLVAIAGTSHTVYAPAAGRDDGAAFLVAPRWRHGEAARALEAECSVKEQLLLNVMLSHAATYSRNR